MYQSHWGLRAMPFNGRVDPKYFFPSPTHEEALARLHFLVENHRRLGIVLGVAVPSPNSTFWDLMPLKCYGGSRSIWG